MTMGLATTIRNNRLTQILNAIDAGSGPGKIKFYDGTRPATGGTATTLLGTVVLADPSGSVSAGALTFTDPAPVTAVAAGTATWARITDSTDAFVADCSVGTSGADINLSTVVFSVGLAVDITSAVITEGNA